MATNNESIHILADRVERLACSKCGHLMDLSDVVPFSRIRCPQCNTKQVAPMRLGSFLLIAEMGKGGMGSVYRAFDQTLGRYVAIKVMQKELAADRKFAENFLREARAAAALNHPNVVQIYSCGQEKGQLYIVMELVDGGRLDQMMEGDEPLDEVFVMEVGTQVAQGLEAANEIGMVHGDIKPANILFDKQRRAKVVDFGLARFAAQQHLQPGEIWGTPYYIAPEKVRSQSEDQRADIYSLGATLYHALAAKPPFDGDTAKDVVLARLNSPALSLRAVRPTLQPETESVIARCLEQDPIRRYPTYKSLLADMEEAVRAARQRQGLPPPKTKREKGRRIKTILAAVVTLSIMAILGVVAWFLLADPEDRPDLPDAVMLPPSLVEEPPPPDDPADGPGIVYAVQPFDQEAQDHIKEAVKRWIETDLHGYESILNELFIALPRIGVERPWVGVLQAMPAWSLRHEPDLLRLLRGIQDAQLRQLEGDEPHPGIMPQALARFMVGQIDEAALTAVAAEWPDWFADFSRFAIGISRLLSGNVAGARSEWRTYLEKTPSERVAWPYHFQPIARALMQKLEEWIAYRDELRQKAAEEALRNLQAYRRTETALLRQAIDAEITQTRRRIQEEANARARAEQQEQQEQAKAELEKIESVRDELFPLVQERDFRRAAAQARQSAMPLQTADGRAALELLVESYDRMESLRRFIIDGIQSNPVPQAQIPELGGDTMGASLAGIRISLGAHGSLVREWNQISERLMASLAEHYIAQLPEDQRADMTLSLAVFAYQTRGMRPAQSFADRAIEMDRTLRDKVRTLMPDLEVR